MHTNFYNFLNEANRSEWHNIDKLRDDANKYETRNEFRISGSTGAYSFAIRHKLMDELFKNHTNLGHSTTKNPTDYWTFDRIKEEAKKFNTRNQLKVNRPGAYEAALKNNMLDDVFDDPNKGYATIKELKKNSYVVYSFEFNEMNCAYVGLSNNIKRREIEHLLREKETVYKFCKQNNVELPDYNILENGLNSNQARFKEQDWVEEYKKNGWEMINILKAGGLGNYTRKWTIEALQKEANKYKTRGEFADHSPVAYGTARANGLIDELFKNHSNLGRSTERKENYYWTKEILQEEANKYETRVEFKKKNKNGYNAAVRLKIMGDIFKNHPNEGLTTSKKINWTFDMLQDEANKYETRNEFKKKNKNAYQTANKRKIMGILFQSRTNQGYEVPQKNIKSFENFKN